MTLEIFQIDLDFFKVNPLILNTLMRYIIQVFVSSFILPGFHRTRKKRKENINSTFLNTNGQSKKFLNTGTKQKLASE